jgi:putative phosphoesterase
MRIGVVSDTHLHNGKQLPKALITGLKGVDLILHAGDWINPDVTTLFESIAPIDGVAGNNDGNEIIQRFGLSKILELKKYRIGMVHGDGFRKTTERRAFETFSNQNVDVIIFGHSHIPLKRHQEGVLLFNPGSPTDKRRQSQYSYGILELKETMTSELYYYDDKS